MAEEQSLNQMEKKHIEVVRNKLNTSLSMAEEQSLN